MNCFVEQRDLPNLAAQGLPQYFAGLVAGALLLVWLPGRPGSVPDVAQGFLVIDHGFGSDAPFSSSWSQLLLRHSLQFAAEVAGLFPFRHR